MKICYMLFIIVSSFKTVLASSEQLYTITKSTHHTIESIDIFKIDKNYFYSKTGKKNPLSEANYLNVQIEIEKFILKHKKTKQDKCENSYQINEVKGCFNLETDPFNLFYFNLHKYL